MLPAGRSLQRRRDVRKARSAQRPVPHHQGHPRLRGPHGEARRLEAQPPVRSQDPAVPGDLRAVAPHADQHPQAAATTAVLAGRRGGVLQGLLGPRQGHPGASTPGVQHQADQGRTDPAHAERWRERHSAARGRLADRKGGGVWRCYGNEVSRLRNKTLLVSCPTPPPPTQFIT